MSRLRSVSRSLSWALTAQMIISVGQLVYAALTARLFTPAEFGGFAAALSLMGILSLLTTTGLPSFVLKEPELGGRAVLTIRLFGLLGGILSAVVFVVLVPGWLLVLGAPEGHMYVGLLAVGQAIGPSAAIEAALLRRELQPKKDALALLASFLLASGCGIIMALHIRQSWTLAAVVALQSLLLAFLSRLLQTHKRAQGSRLFYRTVMGFTRKITAQNTGFFLLQRVPEWIVSASLGSSALGQFTRGASLAQMPATALNAALGRAMQPYWRLISRPYVADRAMNDAATLSAGIAFPIFGIVAVNAGALVDLWLGEGWEQAGALATLLAIGAGLAVPFGGLASGQEMRGNFKHVRRAQWSMAGSLVIPVLLLVTTRSIWWAAAAVTTSTFVGLFVMAISSATSHTGFRVRMRSRLVRRLTSLALWSAGVSVLGLFAGLEAARLVSPAGRVAEAALQISVAGSVSVFAWVLTFRWHETNRVLRRRGVRLPSFVGGRSV
ncbi:oligosaccharide flippase family protein [Arthrobacter sp. W4I7]|uniref:oligosaccharide flippase family protein n=1 Tax=Arthrobacter sp. W4I7 TaxID=3042296 RepID=UPI00278217B5|nr:oligosaccharide flippase family protein [Arthrobacter sp. W4I7]MDQ0689829.1 lipopolysaccharide exporter [Arthrobacter sp. W4I7]